MTNVGSSSGARNSVLSAVANAHFVARQRVGGRYPDQQRQAGDDQGHYR